MNATFDVIIIGGGIMGCSSAFRLGQRGLKVAVLEKGGLGNGSTGRSSAIIRQHYSNEITARMALHSLRVFQNFKDEVGGDSGFTEAGFLVLTPEKDLEGLKANVALQRSVGIQTDLLTHNDITERWPYLEAADLVAAAYEPESGYADPGLTVNSFAQAAKRNRVEYQLDTEVLGFANEVGKGAGGRNLPRRAGSADCSQLCRTLGRPRRQLGGSTGADRCLPCTGGVLPAAGGAGGGSPDGRRLRARQLLATGDWRPDPGGSDRPL